jgi:hypothetical protein
MDIGPETRVIQVDIDATAGAGYETDKVPAVTAETGGSNQTTNSDHVDVDR